MKRLVTFIAHDRLCYAPYIAATKETAAASRVSRDCHSHISVHRFWIENSTTPTMIKKSVWAMLSLHNCSCCWAMLSLHNCSCCTHSSAYCYQYCSEHNHCTSSSTHCATTVCGQQCTLCSVRVAVGLVANAMQLPLPPGASPWARHHPAAPPVASPSLDTHCCCIAAATAADAAVASAHAASTAATAGTSASTARRCLCAYTGLCGLQHLRHPVHFSLSYVQACFDEGVL